MTANQQAGKVLHGTHITMENETAALTLSITFHAAQGCPYLKLHPVVQFWNCP